MLADQVGGRALHPGHLGAQAPPGLVRAPQEVRQPADAGVQQHHAQARGTRRRRLRRRGSATAPGTPAPGPHGPRRGRRASRSRSAGGGRCRRRGSPRAGRSAPPRARSGGASACPAALPSSPAAARTRSAGPAPGARSPPPPDPAPAAARRWRRATAARRPAIRARSSRSSRGRGRSPCPPRAAPARPRAGCRPRRRCRTASSAWARSSARLSPGLPVAGTPIGPAGDRKPRLPHDAVEPVDAAHRHLLAPMGVEIGQQRGHARHRGMDVDVDGARRHGRAFPAARAASRPR